eukprot:7680633-Alexandrium_andersonii.AAC.1
MKASWMDARMKATERWAKSTGWSGNAGVWLAGSKAAMPEQDSSWGEGWRGSNSCATARKLE